MFKEHWFTTSTILRWSQWLSSSKMFNSVKEESDNKAYDFQTTTAKFQKPVWPVKSINTASELEISKCSIIVLVNRRKEHSTIKKKSTNRIKSSLKSLCSLNPCPSQKKTSENKQSDVSPPRQSQL